MNAVIKETVVKTEVPLVGYLPFQVWVLVLTYLKRLDPLTIHRKHITIVGEFVDVLCQIRRTWRDTCYTVTNTEAQVVEPTAGTLHKCLVHDVPTKRDRGEGGPLVIVTELRRTFMTDADQCIIPVGIAVADTSEEADEFVIVSVTTHGSMIVLVGQERTITEVVPQESGSREVCVRRIEAVVLVVEITVTDDGVETMLVPLRVVA